MKQYRFFYHYYKQKGKMSVHFINTCHIVDDVACFVPAFSKWNKRQPRIVMQGWAGKVIITKDKTAIITEN